MPLRNPMKISSFRVVRVLRRAFLGLSAALVLLSLGLPTHLAGRIPAHNAQGPAQVAAASLPNSNALYLQLRNASAAGKVFEAKDLVLKRDAGRFTFRSGHFFFFTPVQGKVTGAVFIGDAIFTLDPPLEPEKRSLELLTKTPEMAEEFSQALFRFTDGTDIEIEKNGIAATEAVPGSTSEIISNVQKVLRKTLRYNLDSRILEDVLGGGSGGFFCAFIDGKKYSSKEIYVIDPHGVPEALVRGIRVAPEEVAFTTYDLQKWGVWAAFHSSGEYAAGTASGKQRNSAVRIDRQILDTKIDKNGFLTGTATTSFVAFTDGVRVVPFNLFPELRVKSVTGPDQQPLSFIQEKYDEDSQFAAILPKTLAYGDRFTITTIYAGPHVVLNEGGGNFYPVARESWYPNAYSFDNFATYEMKFRIPSGMTMVATGVPTGDTSEGDQVVSNWKSEVPIAVAGFNFGLYKKEEAKLTDPNYIVEAYANTETPDMLKMYAGHAALGTLNTTSMLKKALGEEQLAIPLYTSFFGPTLFQRLAATQQTAPNYGQSFPGLVYLPLTAFFDRTTLHQLRIDDPVFFESVGPHEIAHQWWGHTVGWDSYRDQWMSEGFAEFSASLFLQSVYSDGSYDKFWERELKLLTEKDREGFRAIDVGPVTLGYRLATTRAGFVIPRRLMYPKGAYILNMIRMMLWTNETQDDDFKKLMHDFTGTYADHAATTEDFKATVEHHMNASINLTGNHKMDWFFNEYVYGTALPHYHFESSFSNTSDGTVQLHMKLEQSGVDASFLMTVPVYIELLDGKIYRLGTIPMTGNTTFEKDIALRGLTQKPKRAMINYFHDVLCTQ
jgi:Peptidase family M1 domain